MALGQYEAARESLLKASAAADKYEERSILWKILVTLGEVEKASGNADLADRLFDHARAVVDYIAAHAGEMRDVFLGQPVMVRLLGEN